MLTNACARIPTIIFFARTIIFALTCLIDMLHTVLLNFHLQSREICSVIAVTSFLFVIILNTLAFMSFVSFETNIFGDKTLQRPEHLFKLYING